MTFLLINFNILTTMGVEDSSPGPEAPPLLEVALGESKIHIQNLPEMIEASRANRIRVHHQAYADGPVRSTSIDVFTSEDQIQWQGSIGFQRPLMHHAYQDRLTRSLWGEDSEDTEDLRTEIWIPDHPMGKLDSGAYSFYVGFASEAGHRGFEYLGIGGPFGYRQEIDPEEAVKQEEHSSRATAFARAFLLAARLANDLPINPKESPVILKGYKPSLAPEIGYLTLRDLPKRIMGHDELVPADLQSVLEFSYEAPPEPPKPSPRPKKPATQKPKESPKSPQAPDETPPDNSEPEFHSGIILPDGFVTEKPPADPALPPELPEPGIVYPDNPQETPPEWNSAKRVKGAIEQMRPRYKLEDVGGLAHIKQEIKDIALAFNNPEVMQKWNAGGARGILLYGEPGTGKTMLAHALAHETRSTFWVVDSTSLYDVWLSFSGKNMKKIFDEIRSYENRLVVFLDEMDSILGTVEDPGPGGADAERNQVAGIFKQELNTLFAQNPNVLIVGATNNLERIDSALTRTGRFDYKLYVPLPDDEGRGQIISTILASNIQGTVDGSTLYNPDLDVPEIVRMTEGMNGADINEILARVRRSKAMGEIRSGKIKPVSQKDIIQEIDKFRQMG